MIMIVISIISINIIITIISSRSSKSGCSSSIGYRKIVIIITMPMFALLLLSLHH